jgi:hypothetical protein
VPIADIVPSRPMALPVFAFGTVSPTKATVNKQIITRSSRRRPMMPPSRPTLTIKAVIAGDDPLNFLEGGEVPRLPSHQRRFGFDLAFCFGRDSAELIKGAKIRPGMGSALPAKNRVRLRIDCIRYP